MARFQLFVQELGKAPRCVPLAETMVVGRSRRADLVVDDDEVGREQCRIGIADGAVFVEGIGQTNRTHVDGKALDAGQRVVVAAGTTIKIGRTVLQVRADDPTGAPPAAESLDATLVARGPVRPVPAEQEQTADFAAPRRAGSAPETTGGTPRPGGNAADFGQTMDVRAGYRPGTPPPAAAGSDDFGQTMNVPAFRPGRAPGPATSGPPAAKEPDVDAGMTIDLRPAARAPAPPPAAAAGTPAPPPPPPSPPPPAPPPKPAPAAAAPNRPKTVIVPPAEVPAAAATHPLPMGAAELEARLHQAVPRLFVKGEALRRRMRLMKVKSRIGRAETADVLLPNESVSELHAEIEFDGAQWTVRDCGSTNGTLVDGAILRSASQRIGRNTLLGFGSLRGLFLCNDPARATEDRRLELRALQRLVAMGLIARDVAAQVQDAVQRDGTQTIAEILLGDTPLQPTDWVAALQAARSHRSLWDRIRGWFRRPAPRAP